MQNCFRWETKRPVRKEVWDKLCAKEAGRGREWVNNYAFRHLNAPIATFEDFDANKLPADEEANFGLVGSEIEIGDSQQIANIEIVDV